MQQYKKVMRVVYSLAKFFILAMLMLSFIFQTKEKWSFIKKIDVRVPSTFFVIDTKGDRSNGFYESVYKGELTKFDPGIRQIIGGDEDVTR